MVQTNTTLSINSKVKEKAMKILKSKGIKLSKYFESCLVNLIDKYGEEVKKNV